jgi:hypothetical protein
MIKITVDEAYAFDYYSILEIKYKNNYIKLETIDITKEDLISQLSIEIFEKIINSEEYENLIKANELTFNAVDDAKTDKVPASYVDKCNYQRMLAKKDLQKKFFDQELTETKIGYNKLK